MKKRTKVNLTAIAAVLLVGSLAAACDSMNNFRDVEGTKSQDADEYTLWNNLDQFPNIVRVCTDGVAWATTTRDYVAMVRVPEWDEHCKAVAK